MPARGRKSSLARTGRYLLRHFPSRRWNAAIMNFADSRHACGSGDAKGAVEVILRGLAGDDHANGDFWPTWP
jgi:hypothetical protein